ncbi:cyclase [Candidatus Woesearchaeota archaeon]|jgi:arylformamidase|nr:cyclase [Candidatus Woesearchaeota archaeon]|tara:strand:- start:3777 stop:4391 length:615 start_codon:yes stop_codon:yes gene_type:complete
MKIYDLSPEISEQMAVYKNKSEKRPKIKVTRTLKEGTNESKLDIELHTGSHVDAPYHTLKFGNTIEKLSLDKFMGNSIVLDLTKVKDSIRQSNLSKLRIKKNDIVLLKTKNNPDKNFNPDFTYLHKSGAAYLASKKIKAVGIDSLGIERNDPSHETHNILLRKNIPIFEGLDLSKVKQGNYFFHGLPLKIKNGDASPVRAVLVR